VRSAIALQLSRLSSCCAPAGSPSVSSHTHKAQCLFILSFGLENYFFNVDISFMMIEAGEGWVEDRLGRGQAWSFRWLNRWLNG
jgi:hypothetical protein